jgi:protein SCO1/2
MMQRTMLRLIWIAALVGLLAPGYASAQARTLPPAPQTEFHQRLNALLPLQDRFVDDNGRSVRLSEFFGKQPVVLVLGYYHCPNLCSTLMESVLETFAAMDLPVQSYRLLAVSIDPSENAEIAARKKREYMAALGTGANLHLLTGRKPDIQDLARAAGFDYAYDAASGQYAHPSGFLIATPDGHISRYFLGVSFRPAEVRSALQTAGEGRTGSLADQLLLLCAHYDTHIGLHSVAAMTAVRVVGLTVLALLIIGIGRYHYRSRRGGGAR